MGYQMQNTGTYQNKTKTIVIKSKIIRKLSRKCMEEATIFRCRLSCLHTHSTFSLSFFCFLVGRTRRLPLPASGMGGGGARPNKTTAIKKRGPLHQILCQRLPKDYTMTEMADLNQKESKRCICKGHFVYFYPNLRGSCLWRPTMRLQ